MSISTKTEAKKCRSIGSNQELRVAVVQTGGSSAVINSTLAGVVHEAQKYGWKVWGYQNAFEGLLSKKKYLLTNLTDVELQRLRNTPGAFLGSSRLFLTKELFEEIPKKLAAQGMDVLVMIGGNGTMFAAQKLQSIAQEEKLALRVIGVPKTVDNDLEGMEYAPGFGSAARYIAQAVLDIGVDLEAMKTFEQVRIIEVMGRSAGWLAAASALAKRGSAFAPHLIYLPEQAFDERAFLQEIKAVYDKYGFAVAVVGEGIHDAEGTPVGKLPFAELKAGSRIYGGASAYLADQVGQKLGLRARSQDLNMAQRSFAPLRSPVDEKLAYKVGRSAVQALAKGLYNCMVGCKYNENGYYTLPLTRVGGKEKCVPKEFYDIERKMVTERFMQWLLPIVGPWSCSYLTLADIADAKVKQCMHLV